MRGCTCWDPSAAATGDSCRAGDQSRVAWQEAEETGVGSVRYTGRILLCWKKSLLYLVYTSRSG